MSSGVRKHFRKDLEEEGGKEVGAQAKITKKERGEQT